jgi:hypothetical protein
MSVPTLPSTPNAAEMFVATTDIAMAAAATAKASGSGDQPTADVSSVHQQGAMADTGISQSARSLSCSETARTLACASPQDQTLRDQMVETIDAMAARLGHAHRRLVAANAKQLVSHAAYRLHVKALRRKQLILRRERDEAQAIVRELRNELSAMHVSLASAEEKLAAANHTAAGSCLLDEQHWEQLQRMRDKCSCVTRELEALKEARANQPEQHAHTGESRAGSEKGKVKSAQRSATNGRQLESTAAADAKASQLDPLCGKKDLHASRKGKEQQNSRTRNFSTAGPRPHSAPLRRKPRRPAMYHAPPTGAISLSRPSRVQGRNPQASGRNASNSRLCLRRRQPRSAWVVGERSHGGDSQPTFCRLLRKLSIDRGPDSDTLR